MSELLGLSLITSDMTRLLTSRSITTSQLRDLTSDIENIISDIEGLQSPSKMPPPLFPPSSYQSPSATIKATSSVAAQNLPPPPPGGNKALQGSYTGALPLDDHTPISPFQDGDPERSDDKKTTEGADNK